MASIACRMSNDVSTAGTASGAPQMHKGSIPLQRLQLLSQKKVLNIPARWSLCDVLREEVARSKEAIPSAQRSADMRAFLEAFEAVTTTTMSEVVLDGALGPSPSPPSRARSEAGGAAGDSAASNAFVSLEAQVGAR